MVRSTFIIGIFLISLLSCPRLHAEEEVLQFRLQGDLSAAPLFYEPQNKMYGTNFSTAWLLGFKAYWFSLGVETFVDYYALKGTEPTAFFRGAWFDVRSVLSFSLALNQWVELKGGAGGLWLRSAFEYNDSGILAQSSLGLAFLLHVKFNLPWPYLDIELKNTCDLLFVRHLDNSFLGLVPSYTGGVRFNFHPGLSWLGLFLEINGFYWSYASEINRTNSLQLKINAGIALQSLTPTRVYQNPSDAYLIKPAQQREKELKISPPKELDLNEENLARLAKARAGEQFTFTNITFVKGSSQLDAAAKNALDKLASVLKKAKNLYFSISGYSELMGDPKKELDLSVARADRIKSYLIAQGVEPERLKLTQVGQLSSTKIVFLVTRN